MDQQPVSTPSPLLPNPLIIPAALMGPRSPCAGYRFGRGRTGGTTWLDVVIQLALAAGRTTLVGDGDRRNPTLSGLYPTGACAVAVPLPISDETSDMKDWITTSAGQAVSLGTSLLSDMSGGDRAMHEYGRDLAMVDFYLAHGVVPAAFFTCGPEMDDFDHILSIWNAGYFRPENSLLVFNEHLVPNGRTTNGAFDPILARPEFAGLLTDGMRPVFMPRLPCLLEVRRSGLSLLEAACGARGRDGRPLDPVRQFMVRQFLTKTLNELDHAGALSWLP